MLPIIKQPIFPITLPSGKTVNVRSLLSGEYKALLSSVVLGDEHSVNETIESIIRACISDKDIDIDALFYFDIEFLILKLYTLSAGNTIEVGVHCNNKIDDKHCDTRFNIPINLNEVISDGNVESSKIIKVDDEVGIKLTYPTWKRWKKIDNNSSGLTAIKQVISNVFDAENIYYPDIDYTDDELVQFIDNLPNTVVSEISDFVNASPTIKWQRQITCPSCGRTETMTYIGLSDFFG